MYACLVLLLLIAFEVIAIRWWLQREWLPPLFNSWAVLIYTTLLALDFVLVWLITIPFSPEGVSEFAWLPALGMAVVSLVFLVTLFFRWVIKQDIMAPPGDRPK